MGFTVYWVRQPVSHATFERFKTLLPDMLEHSTLQDSVSEVILVPTDDTLQPERFWTRTSSSGFAFAKTSRTPYTTDVMRAVILMVEFGMATLEHCYNDDGDAFPWSTQVEAVNRHLHLNTYNTQMAHFLKGDLDSVLENKTPSDRLVTMQRMLESARREDSKGVELVS